MKKNYIVTLFLLLVSFTLVARTFPAQKDTYVNDYAEILTSKELSQLRTDVKAMCDYYSTQITVAIVSTFGDYDIDEYAEQLGTKWKVLKNDGLLILVKPKSEEDRGEALILTSPDLTDVFTADVCEQIVHENMIPYFKQDDYFGGIEAVLEYMNNMSDEGGTNAVGAATSSDKKEGFFSKIMEFLANLGVGILVILKWLLIFALAVTVVGLIVGFIVKKKDNKEEDSDSMRSNFSGEGDSDEIAAAIEERRQKNEQRKRELEELRKLERESQELEDEYDNIQDSRGRRHDGDDRDDDADASSKLEDLLEKTSGNRGNRVLGTMGKIVLGTAGVIGAAAIGKSVRERKEKDKEDDGVFFSLQKEKKQQKVQ